MSPEGILDPVPVYSSVKADAWDAFHDSADPDDFKAKFDPLPLPHSAKADLWDLKFGAQPNSPTESQAPTQAESEQPAMEGKAPEPPKPNAVERVSPATPNPPTAAIPTAPETPATISIQLQQLGAGHRKAVMFPKGTPPPGNFPPGTALTHDSFGNTYAYRPDLIKRGEISRAAAQNRLPEILGSSQDGMGAPDKTALIGPPVVVAAHSPDGTEAQSTGTDAVNLPRTIAATQRLVPPGGTLRIASPASALRYRGTPPVGDLGTPSAI